MWKFTAEAERKDLETGWLKHLVGSFLALNFSSATFRGLLEWRQMWAAEDKDGCTMELLQYCKRYLYCASFSWAGHYVQTTTDFAMYSGLSEVWTNSHQHASHWKPILTQLWIEPNSPLTSGFTLVTFSRIGQVGSYQFWQVIESTLGYR
jgi:hypothetical protein